ncbi:hypothetical protein [Actinoplanes philippinensis]|uniref:hypothetical protein n=1 Tax=Actinoplanes philippinensis TaxID=35752 RepID=UPI0033C39853
MTATIVSPARPVSVPAPGRAVSRLAIRQIRRGGLIVVAVTSGMTAMVAATFDTVMADPAAAGSLAALAVPLMVLLAATAAMATAVPVAAARREVRGGLTAVRAGRPARLGLLGGVEGFAVRRVLRPLAGWALGIGAYFLLIGLTAVSVTEFLAGNPAMAGQAAEAGFAGLGSVTGFAATLFALLAMPVSGFVAVRLGAFVAAESDRRLVLLTAQPISRARLLAAEIAATTAAAVTLVTVAGLATWSGVAAIGGDLPLTAALQGVWNTLPVAALSLGVSVLATGWAPRRAGTVGALPAVGGFLLLVIAESVGAPSWVREISPYAHLAPVPLTGADWTATAVMLAGRRPAAPRRPSRGTGR